MCIDGSYQITNAWAQGAVQGYTEANAALQAKVQKLESELKKAQEASNGTVHEVAGFSAHTRVTGGHEESQPA